MKDGFDREREIARYTQRITRSIRSRRRRKSVRQEYADHMEDMMTEYMLGGMSEEDAFSRAREELGDETKIEVLLQTVHNKDRLPRLIRLPLYALIFFAAASSYFWIESRTFRAWYVFVCEIALIAAFVIALYFLGRLIRALRKRADAYKRLKTYAKKNGYKLTKTAGVYKSVFRKTTVPELLLDTGETRYIINLWATVRKRKTLRLFDNGLYCYASQVGYMYVFTDRFRITTAGLGSAARFMAYFPAFHSDLFELPAGLHLMPRIDWARYERADGKNVRVLLLSPMPWAAIGLEKSRLKPLRGDAEFCGMYVNSASGFLSYLEGVRLKGSK